MSINFPNSPTTGSIYTQGSNTWVFDGNRWSLQSKLIDNSDINTIELTNGASLIYNSETEKWDVKVDTSAVTMAIALS